METNTPPASRQNQTEDPANNAAALQAGAIVFDAGSGIPLEEQQEILAGINAVTARSRMVPEAPVIKAKKKGFLFPLFVNLGAVIILAAGFFLLSRIQVRDEEEIRGSSAGLGLTERMLIQEIREGANPAIEELTRISGERERAARTEALVGGFFEKVNSQIQEGRLNEASATLTEIREFLDTPLFRGVPYLEAGRQGYLSAINALEKIVSEAARLREAAAEGGHVVLSDALAELNDRYAALEEESAALNAQGLQEATEREALLRRLENSNRNQQETLNRRDAEIVNLRNEREAKDRQLSALNASLAAETAQKEELKRQLNDLQARLDAAMRLFQE